VITGSFLQLCEAWLPFQEGDLPPPPSPNIITFQFLLASYSKSIKPSPLHFVKKLEEIPKVHVHPMSLINFALRLAENGLIG
jgi:hypothetical protein